MATATRLAAEALRLLPRKRLSRAVGKLAAVEGPTDVVERAIATFVRAYDVDMHDSVVPAGGYTSFNDFFTRKLVPGARPVDPNPRVLVSPADGLVEDLGPIDLAATVTVKGKLYAVGDLLGDDDAAKRYEGGSYFIVYLSPRDYHRVHAPVEGRIRAMRYVPGTLYPVNAIGTEHVPRVFARNERIAMMQDSPVHGEVTTIMVGAIGVGRIGVAFDRLETNRDEAAIVRTYGEDGPMRVRGDELGVFNLGSTAIVFATAKADLQFNIKPGDRVRVGEPVATGGRA